MLLSTNFNSPSKYLTQSIQSKLGINLVQCENASLFNHCLGSKYTCLCEPGEYFLNFFNYHSLPLKVLVKTVAKTFLVDLLSNLLRVSKKTVSETPLVFPAMISNKTVPQYGSSDINSKENNSDNKNNSNELLDTLQSFLKDKLLRLETDVKNMIESIVIRSGKIVWKHE